MRQHTSQSGRGTHDGLYRLEEFMRSYYFTRKANAERERRAAGLPPPGGGGKRGRDTKVSLPLLTPQPFLRTRLPSVARLNARGPQGRLVLQGSTLDRSGAFRRRRRTPCTVWPRTVMRGKSRKLTSGSDSVPKSARRTEPSPRNPRFAAHLRCVSAKEDLGESRGGKGTIRCPCPLLPPPWARRLRRQTAALPAAEGGNSSFMMAGSFRLSHRSFPDRAPS